MYTIASVITATFQPLSGKRGVSRPVTTMSDLRFEAWRITKMHGCVAIAKDNTVWQDGRKLGTLTGEVTGS